jgi:hypothetical protein
MQSINELLKELVEAHRPKTFTEVFRQIPGLVCSTALDMLGALYLLIVAIPAVIYVVLEALFKVAKDNYKSRKS